MDKITPLSDILSVMHAKDERAVALVTKAYEYSKEKHKDQKRYSGDPYFIHVAAVGHTLAEMGLDPSTVAAGLLHDVVEDVQVPEEEIEREFGSDIRFLVDGVTKLGKLKYRGAERHVESLRKLFVSTAKDLRVIIIKLADRLHNVSTLKFVPKEKQQRIALETLEIYAPIANRLSIGKLKAELEDYSFPYAYPEEYKKVVELLKGRADDDEKKLEKLYRSMHIALKESGIESGRGEFRVKHMYSLYKKLQRHEMDIDNIYDLSAIRVIVPTVADCYRALGIIHSKWRPLPGRIKDYIAFPKPNGYQSLHTTIFTGDGSFVEVQLRTEEMNRDAAYGVAAHFAYKESTDPEGAAKTRNLDWLTQITNLQHDGAHGDYLENLKTDFFEDRVFIFTPVGDVIDLPRGATPIDFAYAIHTDIGNHTSGAIVNRKMLSLDTPLTNGDIVEIVTKKNAKPSKKWLEFAKTTMARKHIRSFVTKESEREAKERERK
jgi:GTP pyrophosphokinase